MFNVVVPCTHNTMHLGAGYAPHVEVYVSGSNCMRFVDTKGVNPPTAGEADEDGWSICTDGTLRRALKRGTEITVPFKMKAHSPVNKNSNSKTALFQLRSSHLTVAVSWNPKWACNPRIMRDALNKAYKSGKPAKIEARGKLPDRYISVTDMVDKKA